MTKEFCDICGKEITNYSEVSDFKTWFKHWVLFFYIRVNFILFNGNLFLRRIIL